MQTVKKIYMIDNCSKLANQFNMWNTDSMFPLFPIIHKPEFQPSPSVAHSWVILSWDLQFK